MNRPVFCAFEGIDASGKETQSQLTFEWLSRADSAVALLSFPRYKTRLGQIIDKHLHKQIGLAAKASEGLAGIALDDAMMFQCLMTVDKYDAQNEINSYTKRGYSVVLDRWTASAEVYGTIDGLAPMWLQSIQSALIKPDVYFLVDVTVEESLRRRPRNAGSDRYEADVKGMHQRVELYRELWRERKHLGYVVLDGSQSMEEVQQQVRTAIIGWTG